MDDECQARDSQDDPRVDEGRVYDLTAASESKQFRGVIFARRTFPRDALDIPNSSCQGEGSTISTTPLARPNCLRNLPVDSAFYPAPQPFHRTVEAAGPTFVVLRSHWLIEEDIFFVRRVGDQPARDRVREHSPSPSRGA